MKSLSNNKLLWIIILICVVLGVYFYLRKDYSDISSLLVAVVVAVLGAIVQVVFQDAKTELAQEQRDSKFHWFSGFEKDYLLALRYQNRDFDIKGLSTQTVHTLDLERVFVELRLQPQPIHMATSDPLGHSSRIRLDNNPVWWFLSEIETQQKAGAKVVIIGAPGSGKTTLLKHMASILSTSSMIRKKITKNNRIPVLLYLRDHGQYIAENPGVLLPSLISISLKRLDIEPPTGWLAKNLKSGRFIIMFDGLDEVADPIIRRRVISWVERQLKTYPRNSFVITSRPYGYRENPIGGVSVLEIMPFSREQIQHFVRNWYLANEIKSHQLDDKGVQMAAKSGAEDLLLRLESNAALLEIAVNPLLLTMISTVHRFRSSLPGRRVELYREIFEVFLGKRQQSKGIEIDLTPAQQQVVLQSLAYEMMINGQREISRDEASRIISPSVTLVKADLSPNEFLRNIEYQSGLLLERETGVYAFAHKTFQEYLAATHILEHGFETELFSFVLNEWWHETIRLYAAQTDASNIIMTCLNVEPPSGSALALAIQCLNEARQVKPNIRKLLEDIFQNAAEYPDPDIRRVVAEALLSNRIKLLKPVTTNTFIDTGLLSRAEYQLFVDEKRWKGHEVHPAHWKEPLFPAGTAYQPITGITYEDASGFCAWLTDRMAGSGEWKFRLPTRDEATGFIPPSYVGYWLDNPVGSKDIPFQMGVALIPALSHEKYTKIIHDDIRQALLPFKSLTSRSVSETVDVSRICKSITKAIGNQQLLDSLLVEAANKIYDNMQRAPLDRILVFNNFVDKRLFAYDTAVNAQLDYVGDSNFDSAVVDAIQIFNSIVAHSIGPRENRFVVLFLALAFIVFESWYEKKHLLFSINVAGAFDSRISHLIQRYIDLLFVEARSKGFVPAVEGIVFVKEIKNQVS